MDFYQNVLKGKILMEGNKSAYFDIGGIWIALNEETDIPRNEIHLSYTHIAFSIRDESFSEWYEHLRKHHVFILEGRKRDPKDKKSIYFEDPDGHKIELHTGTLEDRLQYYSESKEHIKLYDM
ncbi:metallothiol transferase FosB [Macrococcus sp. DPC7161]|uniref:metallothiol transferase FosB n=1 Tax=Macrococcus sp. DPC7161 TaxID=2507060 RepID=UPI001F0BF35D|nr:metallothiol transferase FosB [Macrococcus sp. DPC7161]